MQSIRLALQEEYCDGFCPQTAHSHDLSYLYPKLSKNISCYEALALKVCYVTMGKEFFEDVQEDYPSINLNEYGFHDTGDTFTNSVLKKFILTFTTPENKHQLITLIKNPW